MRLDGMCGFFSVVTSFVPFFSPPKSEYIYSELDFQECRISSLGRKGLEPFGLVFVWLM